MKTDDFLILAEKYGVDAALQMKRVTDQIAPEPGTEAHGMAVAKMIKEDTANLLKSQTNGKNNR